MIERCRTYKYYKKRGCFEMGGGLYRGFVETHGRASLRSCVSTRVRMQPPVPPANNVKFEKNQKNHVQFYKIKTGAVFYGKLKIYPVETFCKTSLH